VVEHRAVFSDSRDGDARAIVDRLHPQSIGIRAFVRSKYRGLSRFYFLGTLYLIGLANPALADGSPFHFQPKTLSIGSFVRTTGGCSFSVDRAAELDSDGGSELELSDLQQKLLAYRREQIACKDEALFWWAYGRVSMRLGRFEEASSSLERALLLRPELAAAALDYAIALHALGDFASATQLYLRLLDQAEPPEPVATLIRSRLSDLQSDFDERAKRRMLSSEGPKFAHNPLSLRSSINLTRAFDSNPGNAPSLREVQFTTLDGPIYLTLDPKQRPQPTSAWIYDARASIDWRAETGQKSALTLRAFGRAADNPLQSMRGYDAHVNWTTRLPEQNRRGTSELTVFASRQSVEYGGTPLLEIQRIGVGLDLDYLSLKHSPEKDVAQACRIQPALDYEKRQYPLRDLLDGFGVYMGLKLLCEHNGWGWEFGGRAGKEFSALVQRPGGDQQKADLTVSLITKSRIGSTLLRFYASAQHDTEGYNTLIENNKVREVSRHGLFVELVRPLKAPDLQWVINLEAFRQTSSLQLFMSQGYTVQTGLRLTH